MSLELAEKKFVEEEHTRMTMDQLSFVLTIAILTNRTPQDVISTRKRKHEEIVKFLTGEKE
jgi:hypothetical protein